MDPFAVLPTLKRELRHELTRNILPFWAGRTLDEVHGGFVGRIDGAHVVDARAPKSGILNARLLWTFSAALRALGEEACRPLADRACTELLGRFWDPVHGGVYWMLDHRGHLLDARKHIYGQAFALYGLSEYYRATGREDALRHAIALFRQIEHVAADRAHGGYIEAFSRDWVPLDDVRLSEKDADERKSMNTHLHVLEAYTTLYGIWPDPWLRERLEALLTLFLEVIIDPASGHLHLFFDEDWTPRSAIVSYGHDIEASWLLLEAADVLGMAPVRERVRTAALRMARVTLAEGLDDDGGLFYEKNGGLDTDKHWWPQAEALVGFLNAYQETGETDFLAAALRVWAFTRRSILDARGEWFGRVARDGTPYPEEDKVGPWKCPYHNARACLEGMRRIDHWLETRAGADAAGPPHP